MGRIRRRMPFLLPALCALLLLPGALPATAASAGRAAGAMPAWQTFFNSTECDLGDGLCLGGNGTYAYMVMVYSWPSSSINSWLATNNWDTCGGQDRVTSSCPFTVGTGLNAAYQGDPIIELQDNATGDTTCIGSNNNSIVLYRTCGTGGGASTGTEWVLVPTSQGGNCLLNVYFANYEYSQFGAGEGAWLMTGGRSGAYAGIASTLNCDNLYEVWAPH